MTSHLPSLLLATLCLCARSNAQCPPGGWAPGIPPGGIAPDIRVVFEWDPDGAGPGAPIVVAGGSFVSIGGVLASNIAWWNGASWQPLGAGTSGMVTCLGTYNGELIVGGGFNTAGGVPALNIARWNGVAFQPLGAGLDDQPLTCTEFNGELYVGGLFLNSGGVPLTKIGRWNGSSWSGLGAGIIFGQPSALVVHGGNLVIGGTFFIAGGVLASNLALWTGSSWIVPATGPSGQVRALASFNGAVICGGSFMNAGGIPVTSIARFDGVSWQPLGSGLAAGPLPLSSPVVNALQVLNGELIVGGDFTLAGGQTSNDVARWNGTCWAPLGAGLDPAPNQYVRSLAIHEGGVFAGGSFATTGPAPLVALARWSEPNPLIRLSQPGGPGTGVLISNSSLVPGHEYYNVASFEICSGCIGSGPYGGLCATDLGFIYYELAFPLGSYPFHFIAPASAVSSGPYVAPIGASFDAICADFTGGTVSCISRTARFTVQ